MAATPIDAYRRAAEPVFVAQGSPSSLAALARLKEGRVCINRPPLSPLLNEEGKRARRGGGAAEGGQYFEGEPPEVWHFHIGGHRVCEKWLKDRRGRTLTYDDQMHYCKVVAALSETIRLMAEIDVAIPKLPTERAHMGAKKAYSGRNNGW